MQPLAENALRHGVAQRLEGGTVSIEARIEGDELVVAIENPVDGPAKPRSGRPAVGLDNVRRRLEAGYGRVGAAARRRRRRTVPRRDPAAGDPRRRRAHE